MSPDGAAGFGVSSAGLGASVLEVDHALPPQTSAPPQLLPPPIVLGAVLVAAGGELALGWLAERLKTEDDVVFVVEARAGWGAGAGGEVAEKSKRSPRAEEEDMAAGLAAAGGEAEEPQPEEPPPDCLGAAGLESKKLPPLRPENALLLDSGVGRGDPKEPRLENAST